MNRIYAAIDLKSFYASVECIERGLDPLNTNLVVPCGYSVLEKIRYIGKSETFRGGRKNKASQR